MKNTLQIRPGYWTLQAVGWGAITAASVFIALSSGRLDSGSWIRILFSLSLSLTFSHLMWLSIRKARIFEESFMYQFMSLFLITLLFACLASMIETAFVYLTGFRSATANRVNFAVLNLTIAINAFIVFFLWNACYFLFHYVTKYREKELDTHKLSSTVKELELKAIKSSINPHFIFNSLNSIRALVDEDPSKAREAVTALGNILRSSMQTEQQETVTLQKELGIVRDYLSLQHIRFEDRLQVGWEVDPATLNLPVPVMMLQMLVENAVKHGVSRRVNGGLVRIASRRSGDRFELVVKNTGQLNVNQRHTGFGCSSTASRLRILFGDSARFRITETPDGMVEAVVEIPVVQTGLPADSASVVPRLGAA